MIVDFSAIASWNVDASTGAEKRSHGGSQMSSVNAALVVMVLQLPKILAVTGLAVRWIYPGEGTVRQRIDVGRIPFSLKLLLHAKKIWSRDLL
jgi:hypothetical protein